MYIRERLANLPEKSRFRLLKAALVVGFVAAVAGVSVALYVCMMDLVDVATKDPTLARYKAIGLAFFCAWLMMARPFNRFARDRYGFEGFLDLLLFKRTKRYEIYTSPPDPPKRD